MVVHATVYHVGAQAADQTVPLAVLQLGAVPAALLDERVVEVQDVGQSLDQLDAEPCEREGRSVSVRAGGPRPRRRRLTLVALVPRQAAGRLPPHHVRLVLKHSSGSISTVGARKEAGASEVSGSGVGGRGRYVREL